MDKQHLYEIIKLVLGAVGAILVTLNLDENLVAAIIGAVLAVLAAIWGIVDVNVKNSVKAKAEAAETELTAMKAQKISTDEVK